MFNNELIKKFQDTPTPFYFYDLDQLEQTILRLKSLVFHNNYQIHYALKANVNEPILQMIRKHGFGADCVSGNEILQAIRLGFDPQKIVFAGVGKSDEEICLALDHNIGVFNCESLQEVRIINEIALERDKVANIAIRINPNVEAKTHHYITTGMQTNKFGFSQEELDELIASIFDFKAIEITGLHFHIGSQITDINVFKKLCLRVNEIQDWFNSKGFIFDHINLGGGLGIDYQNPDKNPIPDFEKLIQTIEQNLIVRSGQEVHLEPGRSIVGQCGNLITKVLYVKNGGTKKFAVVDAGFTELIRPALYQAYHKIQNISSNSEPATYDIVGPLCESTDSFGSGIDLPETKRGDLIVLRSAGAYGEVMTSYYNLRNKVKSYYSSDLTEQGIADYCSTHLEDVPMEINMHP
ncbi:MAG: diaminopimelate decarboxylase [Bacteroidetes bacterium]|nr:diaminopimelate decarboxylase [Bacteroidota bacterium]